MCFILYYSSHAKHNLKFPKQEHLLYKCLRPNMNVKYETTIPYAALHSQIALWLCGIVCAFRVR